MTNTPKTDAVCSDADLCDVWEAAARCGVKPGTIRVWTHRGKLPVAKYVADPASGDPQPFALYRIADVEAAVRDRRRKRCPG